MSIRKSFSFTLNTTADTFCTWVEDQSRGWRVEFTTDEGFLDLQKTRLSKHNSRTFCTFDVVKEIAPNTSYPVKGVIQLLVSPAPRAGQVDIRAVCRMEWAWDCFSYVLSQIAAAYPEADVKIREKEDKRVVLDLPDKPKLTAVPRKYGPSRYSDDEKIRAVYLWDKLDKSIRAQRLDEFLDELFGNEDGTPNVPNSTFYGWKKRFGKKFKVKSRKHVETT